MKSAVVTRKASKQELKQAFKARPQAIDKHEVTYRNIAKMLASALQVESEFAAHVEQFLHEIEDLPKYQRNALKYAYIFSRKAPKEERQDLYQELSLRLLEARCKNDKLAYAIARCDWKDFWKAYKLHSQYNLDSIERMADSEDGGGYGQDAIDRRMYHAELLTGECEFEATIDSQILFSKLPHDVQGIVAKKLSGYASTKLEQSILRRFVNSNPVILAGYVNPA